MKRTLLIVIGLGVVGLLIASLFALGFLSGPSNNSCPSIDPSCQPGNPPPVPFTIQLSGRVVNPTWNPPYVVIDTIVAFQGSTPGISLALPKLDFWNNNYALTLNYCITYPSGNTYCTGRAFAVPPVQVGTVQGSGQIGYTFNMYHNGPRGSYSIQVSLVWTMTGCNGTTCASGVVTKGSPFSV